MVDALEVQVPMKAKWLRASGLPFAVFIAVSIFLVCRIAPFGFNPTDDGLVLQLAARIRVGQVPHVDFFTPRPAGSGLIHLVDFALPFGLLLSSRIVAFVEIATYTTLFATVTLGSGPRSWGTLQTSGVALALFANLHTYPMMAWHTIDGLLLVSIGYALLMSWYRAPNCVRLAVGMAFLGAAPLVKQSFAVAPVLGLAFVTWRLTARHRLALPSFVISLGAGMAPGLLYLIWISSAGGIGTAFHQLAGVQPVWGQTLFQSMTHADWRFWGPVVATGTATALRSVHRRHRVTFVVVAGIATAFVVAVPIEARYSLAGLWGIPLFWALALIVIAHSLQERKLDVPGVALAAAGWMASLSWGYPVPDLVAGNLGFAVVVALWRDIPGQTSRTPRAARNMYARATRVAVHVVSVAAAIVGLIVLLNTRSRFIYRDSPAPHLTADLGQLTRNGRGIKTNTTTMAYLANIKACAERFHTRRVAVVPDNPGVSPLLGFRNPLSIDWMYPPEFAGHESEILREMERPEGERDYLILFQTIPAATLANQPALPSATLASPLFTYGSSTIARAYERLPGVRSPCGSFIAVTRLPG